MYGETITIPRPQVFATLKQRGIAKVVVSFSGGNDEGGADGITATLTDGTEREMLGSNVYEDYQTKKKVIWENGANREATPDEIAESSLGAALEQPVYDKYYSFAGEFHVSGEVIWDVEEQRVTMSGSESHETYEGFEDEL